jgi:hypothetical protein
MGEAEKVDLNELWQIAVRHALGKYAGDFARRQIEALLEKADGNVAKAVQIMGDRSVTDASRLPGHWGVSCKQYRVQCWGSAARHPVEAWSGPDHWDREPDLVVQWIEIFQFVQGTWQPRLL